MRFEHLPQFGSREECLNGNRLVEGCHLRKDLLHTSVAVAGTDGPGCDGSKETKSNGGKELNLHGEVVDVRPGR